MIKIFKRKNKFNQINKMIKINNNLQKLKLKRNKRMKIYNNKMNNSKYKNQI